MMHFLDYNANKSRPSCTLLIGEWNIVFHIRFRTFFFQIKIRTRSFIRHSILTPYCDIDLDQHRLMLWIVAWWHQAIISTNVDLSSKVFYGIHLSTISQKCSRTWPVTCLPMKRKCHQWLSARHWRRWKQASTSSVMTRVVTLTTFPFLYWRLHF